MEGIKSLLKQSGFLMPFPMNQLLLVRSLGCISIYLVDKFVVWAIFLTWTFSSGHVSNHPIKNVKASKGAITNVATLFRFDIFYRINDFIVT